MCILVIDRFLGLNLPAIPRFLVNRPACEAGPERKGPVVPASPVTLWFLPSPFMLLPAQVAGASTQACKCGLLSSSRGRAPAQGTPLQPLRGGGNADTTACGPRQHVH